MVLRAVSHRRWSDQTNELSGLLTLKPLIFGTDTCLQLALSFQAQLSRIRCTCARMRAHAFGGRVEVRAG